MKQTNITEKLKTGSKWLTVVFAAGGTGSIIRACSRLFALLTDMKNEPADPDFMIYDGVQRAAESLLLAAMLLTAAFIFRRISRSGVPFDAKTIRSVRIIGCICIFQGMGSHLPGALLARAPFFSPADLFPLHIIAEGFLFLFAAKMMKYGTLLQTEADETV